MYYNLRQDADPTKDVIFFRWRVEQIANNYATGPSAGSYGASDPWSSALWTVLFDVNGDGYADLAAHLDGSSGAPATAIDRIAGIWSKLPTQSLDYVGDPTNVKLLAHNPTAFAGTTKILNFHNNLTPDESWPNGSSETIWDYGTTRAKVVTTSPCTEYFIDYQIPVQMLDASSQGGPKITRSSPISMLFCTANSLNNPFQKDCALNKTWVGAAARPGPFGDYISFNQAAPYAQPVVSAVTAQAPTSCPGAYTLTATVQDTLALVNGTIVPSVKGASFWYYYDTNGNGLDDDGNAWTLAANATLKTGTLNTWTATWDATNLAKGQYLIGVQAVDDNTKVDDGVTPSGVDNRTFSYVTGDSQNRIYVGGTSYATVPTHSPSMTPVSSENWWGNPSVTGIQTALVGVALNTCGVAPTLGKTASVSSVAANGTVDFTLTISNLLGTAITLSQISDTLPSGFTYTSTTGGTLTPSTSPSGGATGTLTWTFSTPVTIAASGNATLIFRTTAPATSGNYSNTATATTSFGTLTSAPVSVAVDSARLSLSKTPNVYSIDPDGTTQLVYTLAYSNDSTVSVTNASISDTLPSGVTYVSCSGGSSCSNSSGTVTWTLGTLAGGATGSVTLTVTVNTNYSTSSLTNSATLAATDPGGNAVNTTASSTIAVNIAASATAAAFTLTKTSSAAQVAPGGSVTWTITYANYGGTTATGVTITDTLPSGFTFSSCTGSCSGSPGTWSIGSVAAGASGSVTVTATATDPFTATNPATNSASLNWTENTGSAVTATSDVGVTGSACSTYYFHAATTNVGAGADGGTQRVATTTAPTSATATTVGFSATTTPAEAVRFYQDPPTANDVSFSGDITTSFYVTKDSGPQLKMDVLVYDYDPSSGNKTSLGSQSFTQTGSGTNQLFSFTLPLSGTLTNGHRILWIFNAYSNNTTTFTFNFDGTGSPSGANFCVTPPANLTLSKTVDKASVTGGTSTSVQYTLTFANTGQTKATAAQVVDTLPTGVTFVSATLNGASVTPSQSGQQLTFSNVKSSTDATAGEISGGASGTIVINATVGSSASGTLTNTASISSTQTSSVTATATTTVTSGGGGGSPALSISKSANKTLLNAGDTVTYTLTVVNTGTASASNVQVSDVLPVATYYTYGTCPAGTGGISCTNSSGTLTWNVGTLAAGASATYTFTMSVASTGLPAGVTVIPDTASASATSVASVDSNTVNVTLSGNPNLALTKSANPSSSLKPGDTVTYTLTVTNTGSAAASSVVVTDPIPSGATYQGTITASAGSGSFDTVNNRVVFNVGTLAAGAAATLTFQVSIASLPAGPTTITNTATASAANASSRSASTDVSASATSALTLTKSAPAQVAYPAATLTQAANGTTLFVNDTTQLTVGQYVSVGGSAVLVSAITGNTITVGAPVSAASGTSVIGGVTYALTYQNTGTATATSVTLTDTLPAGVTFVAASNGGTLAGGTVTWNLGDLDPGTEGSVQLTVIPGGAGTLVNNASITCGACSATPASATTAAGGLQVFKRTTTPTAAGGGSATYIIDVENTSGSTISGVTVTDTLASGFSYASTTSIVNGGVATTATTSPTASDTVLSWGTFAIQAGKVLTVTFVANIAASTGAATYQNAAGATPLGSTVAFDPLNTTAEDVTVLASSTGVVQGNVFQDNNNNGVFEPNIDTPLTGARITITGSTYTAATDSSGYFSRVVPAGQKTVEITSADIPSGLVLGSTFINPETVTVPDGGSATKDTGYIPLSASPDLTIAKAHVGNFTQGQTGATYTLTVTNAGSGPTSGTVTVSDTLPTGLTATGIAGTGWTCVLGTLTCTRSDSLGAGLSYPVITVTVNVANNASSAVTNVATVSGGGEVDAGNDTASSPTTINQLPDLTITKSHTGNFTQGQTGATYTITVSNSGSGPTSGTVTVVDTLPSGLTATAISGAGWTCTLSTLTCTRSDSLGAGLSYPAITVTVNVATNAAAGLTNTASVSGGGETNTSNDSASDVTTVNALSLPDLTIAKAHVGNFTQGQTGATYTLTVTNAGSGQTSETVTVSDTLPTGLTATGIAGTGWTCVLGTLTCTRSDSLGAGLSYPAITVTVNVANNAPSAVTNVAAVSGGGEVDAGNDTASDPTTVNASPDLSITKTGNPNPVVAGQNITYTLFVTNNGPSSASNVTVTDTLPAGVIFQSASGPGWTCNQAGGVVTCTVGSLAGGTASNITIAVTAPANGGVITNTATVSSAASDPTPGNNTATQQTQVVTVSIPTLSEWGMIFFALLLGLAFVYSLGRRKND